MPLRNRVDPYGNIHAVPQRGAFMGNRGNLHSENQEIVRSYKHKSWVTCVLSYHDRHREVMTPGAYTELFFLDEATSLSAGHRPCGTCRKEKLDLFKDYWLQAGLGHAGLREIDALMHIQRTHRMFPSMQLSELPNGVFVRKNSTDTDAHLLWGDLLFKWTFDGYLEPEIISGNKQVDLITPPCLMEILRTGYPIAVDSSIG